MASQKATPKTRQKAIKKKAISDLAEQVAQAHLREANLRVQFLEYKAEVEKKWQQETAKLEAWKQSQEVALKQQVSSIFQSLKLPASLKRKAVSLDEEDQDGPTTPKRPRRVRTPWAPKKPRVKFFSVRQTLTFDDEGALHEEQVLQNMNNVELSENALDVEKWKEFMLEAATA